jgi:carboxymethylenebutenolidase
LDGQATVNRAAKMGVQGYCMGGPMAVRTAAALGERIGAAASFHGGGLVTDKPGSPHLLAPKISARMYFAVAGNDDAKDPAAKDTLREAFEAAGAPVEVELYPDAQHGWCMPDFPVYKVDDAERAWGKLLELYRAGLTA